MLYSIPIRANLTNVHLITLALGDFIYVQYNVITVVDKQVAAFGERGNFAYYNTFNDIIHNIIFKSVDVLKYKSGHMLDQGSGEHGPF